MTETGADLKIKFYNLINPTVFIKDFFIFFFFNYYQIIYYINQCVILFSPIGHQEKNHATLDTI